MFPRHKSKDIEIILTIKLDHTFCSDRESKKKRRKNLDTEVPNITCQLTSGIYLI